jgi:hypothetical protein
MATQSIRPGLVVSLLAIDKRQDLDAMPTPAYLTA